MNKLTTARRIEVPNLEAVQASLYRPIDQLNKQAQPIIEKFADTASDTLDEVFTQASQTADDVGQRISRFGNGLFSRKNQKAATKAAAKTAQKLRSKAGNRIANLRDSVSNSVGHRLADVVDTGALVAGAGMVMGKSARYVRKHPVLVIGGLLAAGLIINQLLRPKATTIAPEVQPQPAE